MLLTIYFDGACEPVNPGGIATFGVVIAPDGRLSGVVGRGQGMTNNVAEYAALEAGLKEVREYQAAGEVVEHLAIRGDSKLVVNQIKGSWRCNHDHLIERRDRCLGLLNDLGISWDIEWIPREQNTEADELSKQAYEKVAGKPAPSRR